MSTHSSTAKRDSSRAPASSNQKRQKNVVPRGFLGEVAMVAIAVVALTVNMKLMSWLSKGSRHGAK
jgi:hypothetical protein